MINNCLLSKTNKIPTKSKQIKSTNDYTSPNLLPILGKIQ